MKGRHLRKSNFLYLFSAVSTGAFLLPTLPVFAAFSLDGANCVIFDGAPKRDLAQCVSWTGSGHTLSVTLSGRAPNNVSQVILSRDGKPPFQTLHVSVRPLISNSDVGIRFQDLNFDGHIDLAIMHNSNQGNRHSYLYYLFNPVAQRFTGNETLALLTNPVFDEAKKRVRVRWRQGKKRGTDAYAWLNGHLWLRERTVRSTAPRACTRQSFHWQGNIRHLVSSTEC